MTSAPKKRHGSLRVPCSACGTELRRSPSELRATGRAYCSIECRDVDRKNWPKVKRSDAGTRKAPFVVRPCEVCGTSVERRVSDLRPHVYCSRRCSAIGQPRDVLTGRPPTSKPGDRKIKNEGYVVVFVGKGEPMADHRGWVPEHRIVMAEQIGRPLTSIENVHHVNGVKDDNRPENLELWVKTQPCGQRVADLLTWARQIIATYEPIEERVV